MAGPFLSQGGELASQGCVIASGKRCVLRRLTHSLELLLPYCMPSRGSLEGSDDHVCSNDCVRDFQRFVRDLQRGASAVAATNMHAPQITFSSSAAGIGGGQMVGVGNQHAILWPDENPAHAISLNPVGTGLDVFRAEAFGVSGGRQVGVATLSPDGGNSLLRAWLWNSSASSWVNLHPGMDGSTHSTALGIEGNQQVGRARFFTGGLEYHRAVLWSGTAASRVYLSPPSLHFNTKAVATDGVQQVGAYYDSSDVLGAALWAGSAASYVNLNPAGAVESQATDVENGKQVGYSRFGTSQHAGYWTGSASSWVDLHPDGALSLCALGIAGNFFCWAC